MERHGELPGPQVAPSTPSTGSTSTACNVAAHTPFSALRRRRLKKHKRPLRTSAFGRIDKDFIRERARRPLISELSMSAILLLDASELVAHIFHLSSVSSDQSRSRMKRSLASLVVAYMATLSLNLKCQTSRPRSPTITAFLPYNQGPHARVKRARTASGPAMT